MGGVGKCGYKEEITTSGEVHPLIRLQIENQMTTEELQQIIDYIKECEEALANFDMDSLAMQTELPKLHQTIEQLMKASSDSDEEDFRVLLASVEKRVRDCRNCCLRRTGMRN